MFLFIEHINAKDSQTVVKYNNPDIYIGYDVKKLSRNVNKVCFW